ncbi:putative transmembrane protein [Cavenderia fasciculata]|uniref:Transmembrane protein n=1 Tax=Cavenderia fasciculata TaxID=261658 RepID=F4QD64_CACFS|nr:putative transmembrane protein [Cavenderia fasciculata]EGG14535.1 putative transmembrane protein [Cavenderia fasciculata]|eukprot:XP_004353973.1 putative transmembrane protein [Cavenderia fasciculata]
MNRIILALLFVVSVLSVASNASLASTNFDGLVSLEIGNDAVRAYVISLSEVTQTMVFSGASVFGSVLGDDNVSYSFDTSIFTFESIGNFITYTQAYASGSGSATTTGGATGSVAAFAAIYKLFALAEYEETNGEDGFQIGEDKLEGWLLLGNPSYKFSKQETDLKATLSNGTEINFKAYNVLADSGLVALRFTVSDAPVEIEGTTISSETSKIDIEINGYFDSSVNKPTILCSSADPMFSCGSTGPSTNPNSRVALISAYVSANVDASFNSNVQGGIISGGAVQGKFEFVTTVDTQINGTAGTANVITNAQGFAQGDAPDFLVKFDATANIGLAGQFLVQTFDAVRPDTITWDPSVGVEKSSFAITLIPSLSLVVFIVFGLLI